jgi:hypothetical protein
MVGQKKKVVELVPPLKQNNDDCVNILREALKRAKRGDVHGVAVCLAMFDPTSESQHGSMHMVRYAAAYKEALYMGVGAMEFGMKHDMWDQSMSIDKEPLTDSDE